MTRLSSPSFFTKASNQVLLRREKKKSERTGLDILTRQQAAAKVSFPRSLGAFHPFPSSTADGYAILKFSSHSHRHREPSNSYFFFFFFVLVVYVLVVNQCLRLLSLSFLFVDSCSVACHCCTQTTFIHLATWPISIFFGFFFSLSLPFHESI